MKRFLSCVKILVMLVSASIAMFPSAAFAAQEADPVFRYALTEGAPKYFIQAIGGGAQQYVAMLMFDPLVEADVKTFDIWPNLAESWTISPDGLIYTFKLVRNATWHDGKPFTSADVKYTFEYIIEKKLQGFGFLQGIETIKAPDDYTVVITLKSADASFLIKVNGRYSGLTDILPKHILDGTDWTKNNEYLQRPIGTGPYKFGAYDGTKVELTRNDKWFRGRPPYAKIVATLIPDVTLAGKAFENNDIDWIYTGQVASMSEFSRMKNLPGNSGEVYFSFFELLEFNVAKAPFDNPKVRQAFAYGIDREELNKKIFLGMGLTQTNPVFPEWLWATSKDVKISYNLETANKLLDEAGLKRGADGTRLSVKISYAAPYSPPPEFVDVLKSQLEKLGISVAHEPNQWDVWRKKVYTDRNFDVALHHTIVVGDPEIGLADEVVPGRLYYFGYENAEIVDLYKQAAAKTTRADRNKIYAVLQQKLAEAMPYTALVAAPTPMLWKTAVIGGILKGDVYRLRYAQPPVRVTATTTTRPTTTAPPPPPPQPDYTSYVAVAMVAIVVAVAAFWMTRRKPKQKN